MSSSNTNGTGNCKGTTTVNDAGFGSVIHSVTCETKSSGTRPTATITHEMGGLGGFDASISGGFVKETQWRL